MESISSLEIQKITARTQRKGKVDRRPLITNLHLQFCLEEFESFAICWHDKRTQSEMNQSMKTIKCRATQVLWSGAGLKKNLGPSVCPQAMISPFM